MTSINFPAWPDRLVTDESVGQALAKEMDRRLRHRACVVMSGSLFRDPGVTGELKGALRDRLVGFEAALPQHSSLPHVLGAAERIRTMQIDTLVSIGGGSVIDAVKIVQNCLVYQLFDEISVRKWRYGAQGASGAARPHDQIVHLCVPTTLSGAEFTFFAGIRNPATGLKDAFVNPELLPRTVIFDQLLSFKTPESLWLSSGVRAIDHAVEGLCSDRLHPLGKAIAVEGIASLFESLRATKAVSTDLAARKRSQFGGWFASIPLMSGVTMGASHAIGHVLGSRFDVPHGITSCVLLPAVMQFNYAAVPERFEAIARAMGGHSGHEAASLLRRWIADLGLPTTLAQIGIGPDAFERIIEGTLEESWLKTNPRPIRAADDIVGILRAAA
jgi:maleylacetate reductase